MTAPLGPNVLAEFARIPRLAIPLVQSRIRAIAHLHSMPRIVVVVVIEHVASPAVEARDAGGILVVVARLIARDVPGPAIDARPTLVTVDAMLAVDVRRVEPGQIVIIRLEERPIDAEGGRNVILVARGARSAVMAYQSARTPRR